MLEIVTQSRNFVNTPSIIGDVLFVREWMKRKTHGIQCRRIRDVYAETTEDGGALCRIDLDGDKVTFAVDNPAMVRNMWLAWATDNLRFTTEVHHGK